MVQPLVSPWRAVGSSQEVHTLWGAVGGKAGDALAGGEIGGSEWVLALAAATEDGTVSVSTLGDTGYPRVARESAFSDAGVCNLTRSAPASRQEVLLKQVQKAGGVFGSGATRGPEPGAST